MKKIVYSFVVCCFAGVLTMGCGGSTGATKIDTTDNPYQVTPEQQATANAATATADELKEKTE